MTAMLIARFPGDPDKLGAAYDRAHQLIALQPGPPIGELRHHCAIGDDALYIVGLWRSEAHITARFTDLAFQRLLRAAAFPTPDAAEITVLHLHATTPPIDRREPMAMNPAHPNFTRTQQSWDGIAESDFTAALDQLADDVIIENGPGAGPWRHIEGRDAFIQMAMEFLPIFGDTWRQDGTCLYADDSMSIALVHETGTTPAGDVFDNTAVYITRIRPDGIADRVWTVDLDTEAVESFWARNSP